MPLDEMPLAPLPEPAVDGFIPGQPECRQPACNDPRKGYSQHCQKHQPKAQQAPVDWDALRQQKTSGRRKRSAR